MIAHACPAHFRRRPRNLSRAVLPQEARRPAAAKVTQARLPRRALGAGAAGLPVGDVGRRDRSKALISTASVSKLGETGRYPTCQPAGSAAPRRRCVSNGFRAPSPAWRRAYSVGLIDRGAGATLPPRSTRKGTTMGNWKKAGLIGLGAVLGVLLSLNFSAIAHRDARMPIPYEDLQLLSAVFGKIKTRLRRARIRRQAHQGSHQRHGPRARPAFRLPRRRSVQGPADLDAGQVRRPRHRGRRRGRHRARRLADRGHAGVPRRHQVRRPDRQDRRHRHARPAAVQGRRQDARQARHAGRADRSCARTSKDR